MTFKCYTSEYKNVMVIATLTLTLVVASMTISLMVMWMNEVPFCLIYENTIYVYDWAFFVLLGGDYFSTKLGCFTSCNIIFVDSIDEYFTLMIYKYNRANH